jgi:serine/threonine protein kinase
MEWVSQIIQGLSYIHSLNIIHRDLKPGISSLSCLILLIYFIFFYARELILLANILLQYSNNTLICKITDFGFSKLLSRNGLTQTYLGSPLYEGIFDILFFKMMKYLFFLNLIRYYY